MIENLLVGSGPSAIAAAMALRRVGLKFQCVDAGFDLEEARAAQVAQLATTEPGGWPDDVRRFIFPPPITSTKGVEKRFAFGSDFPYRMPHQLEIEGVDCQIDVSHGFGGFGNVWGAAVLPWTDNDLVNWPIRAADLAASYRNVASFIPISSVSDGLEPVFPRFATAPAVSLSAQGNWLREVFAKRKSWLEKNGVRTGQARVAVDASDAPTGCRYCGHCLDGCAYGSIFNPKNLWLQLEAEGIQVNRGQFVQELRERDDAVDVMAVDIRTGAKQTLRARRVLLATGALNSTRIIARSLGLIDKPIRLLDSQYFFFPFLSYRKHREIPQFTLAEHFVEILNSKTGLRYTHFQVYGLNSLFQQTIRAMVPRPFRSPLLTGEIEKRFFLFQGFLHSEDSGSLEWSLVESAESKDRIKIRGIPHPDSKRVAYAAKKLIARALWPFGIVPPVYLKMVSLGRSFHIGGSFPMSGNDPVFRSDRQGRPAGLSRVHLLDASTFPSIPATTITYTIMANADRIIHELSRGTP